MAKAKAKVGRPTKYMAEMCEQVIELGKLGKSRTQMAAALGVLTETMGLWGKAHPEFSDALKRANEFSQAWWEDMGQAGLGMGKDFNATAFIFQMKNRFRADYTDVHKLEHSGDEAFLSIMKTISTGAVKA